MKESDRMPFGPDGEPGDVVAVDGELFQRRWSDSWVSSGDAFDDWADLTAYSLRYECTVQRYTKAERYTVTGGEVTRDE